MSRSTAGLRGGLPLHLPVAEYLSWAAREQLQRRARTRKRWESPLWHLIRLARVHPQLGHLAGPEVFGILEGLVIRWAMAISDQPGQDVWKVVLGVGRDDAQIEIYDAWDRVRERPDTNPIEQALGMAFAHPLKLPWEHLQGRPSIYPRFVSLAGWQQVLCGDRPILLPVASVGELLRIPGMSVSRLRNKAIQDGYLEAVRLHDRQRGRATEFRFDLTRFPQLESRARESAPAVLPWDEVAVMVEAVLEHYQKTTGTQRCEDQEVRASIRNQLLQDGATFQAFRLAIDEFVQRHPPGTPWPTAREAFLEDSFSGLIPK